MIKKPKNTVLWTYVVNDVNGKGSAEMFCKKKLQKTNQRLFRIGDTIKKLINYMLNGKDTIIRLIAG